MPSRYGPPPSTVKPPPLRWDAGRDDRGARPGGQPPRCTTRGCIVRYRDGEDRPCAEHRAEHDAAAAAARTGAYRCGGPEEDG